MVGRTDDRAPGWDAITEALTTHGFTEPQHFGTDHLPDQDGAYAYAYADGDDWLLLTLGLTELFGKVSTEPSISGWGFELTMRVPRIEPQPPSWALNLLLKLSEYVFSQGKPFADGHRMSPGGPITGRPDTRLTALAFTADPVIGAISTPFGSVHLLTVVGITAEELAQMQATSTADVLNRMRADNTRLVTDPGR